MIGYDISWAGFNIIEVMSSNKFTFKRIGYLAGSQCFHPETEVIWENLVYGTCIVTSLSITFAGINVNYEHDKEGPEQPKSVWCWGSTIRSSVFHQPRLGSRLGQWPNDAGIYKFNFNLPPTNSWYFIKLSSTKPYIRKKAVLLMYKVFLAFPDALRPAFPRLKEKLEDPDPGINIWLCHFSFTGHWLNDLSSRCSISSSQCCLWIGKKEPQKLSQFSSHLFQIDDVFN